MFFSKLCKFLALQHKPMSQDPRPRSSATTQTFHTAPLTDTENGNRVKLLRPLLPALNLRQVPDFISASDPNSHPGWSSSVNQYQVTASRDLPSFSLCACWVNSGSQSLSCSGSGWLSTGKGAGAQQLPTKLCWDSTGLSSQMADSTSCSWNEGWSELGAPKLSHHLDKTTAAKTKQSSKNVQWSFPVPCWLKLFCPTSFP